MKKSSYSFSIFSLVFFYISIASTPAFAQPACLGEQGKLKWLLYENQIGSKLGYLTSLHRFPNTPNTYENILAISSPGIVSKVTEDENTYYNVRYANAYGSMIRGYITVPETGIYTFNITGRNQCEFYLSTDETKANLALQASVDDWTRREQYAKETNQTSDTITLQAGAYYYFKVLHKASGGGDHVEVKWKTPFDQSKWQPIAGENIYDYACALDCAETGTTCDDGNANTINDKEDGFCNCIGTPISLPDCVGTQGEIRAFYYFDILGGTMSSFLEAPKYPSMPDTLELLEATVSEVNVGDHYGVKIAGMLKVPVTGAYQFNVTANDHASFEMSTDENPDNLKELSYCNWTATPHDHYRSAGQVRAPVTLSKDNFYYFEIHYREIIYGADRFAVYWRTPFTNDTLWRHINKAYIYDYACEMACVPEGTPCDDENNFTKDDKYDDACNCVGIPCKGGDCEDTPTFPYTPNDACGVSEKMDNSAANAWESCTPSVNPNASRGISHWAQYDFKQVYLLNETHIWNYNGTGNIGKGFKDVVIDYSIDGTNWTQLGNIFQWEQATGTVGYEGFEGPDFNGITARYVLITALNTWGNGTCSGFNKITFTATDCLLMGQLCDDGDPNSINDKYDENCNCTGEGEGFSESGICEDEIIQSNITLLSKEYRASQKIVSEGIVHSGSDVTLMAGEYIQLMPGFSVASGADFLAIIGNCTQESANDESDSYSRSRVGQSTELVESEKEIVKANSVSSEIMEKGITSLQVSPNPSSNWTSLTFNLPSSSVVSLCIYASDGKQISCLANNQAFEKGVYTKAFPAQQISTGVYYVILKTANEVLTKPLVIIE